MKNEELCVKNEGFCIENDEFCSPRWQKTLTTLFGTSILLTLTSLVRLYTNEGSSIEK